MPTNGTDGRAIIRAATERLVKLAAELRATESGADFLPVEHLRATYAQKLAEIRKVRSDAERELANWAGLATEQARRRLAAKTTPDAGEELRIQRLVSGPLAGDDLAVQADAAYESGDLVGARILATAAIAKAPAYAARRLADETLRLVDYDEVSADPERSAGRRALDDVGAVLAIGARDLNASASWALRDAAALLKRAGGHDTAAGREMVQASMTAKLAAFLDAQDSGSAYQEPAGSLPGGPTGENAPEGARVPGAVYRDAGHGDGGEE